MLRPHFGLMLEEASEKDKADPGPEDAHEPRVPYFFLASQQLANQRAATAKVAADRAASRLCPMCKQPRPFLDPNTPLDPARRAPKPQAPGLKPMNCCSGCHQRLFPKHDLAQLRCPRCGDEEAEEEEGEEEQETENARKPRAVRMKSTPGQVCRKCQAERASAGHAPARDPEVFQELHDKIFHDGYGRPQLKLTEQTAQGTELYASRLYGSGTVSQTCPKGGSHGWPELWSLVTGSGPNIPQGQAHRQLQDFEITADSLQAAQVYFKPSGGAYQHLHDSDQIAKRNSAGQWRRPPPSIAQRLAEAPDLQMQAETEAMLPGNVTAAEDRYAFAMTMQTKGFHHQAIQAFEAAKQLGHPRPEACEQGSYTSQVLQRPRPK